LGVSQKCTDVEIDLMEKGRQNIRKSRRLFNGEST